MKVIAIHGKARSGKDELAKILCMTYGFTRVGFADKLKEYAIQYFLLKPEIIYESKTKESRAILQALGSMVRNQTDFVKESYTSSQHTKIGVSGFPEFVEKIAASEFNIQEIDFKRNKSSIKNVFNGIYNLYKEKLDYFIKISNGRQQDIWVNIILEDIKNKDEVFVISDLRFKNEKNIIERIGGKAIKILRIDNPEIETGEIHQSEIDLDSDSKWDYLVVNEHKDEWRNSLSLAASNIVRKFNSQGMFSQKDIEKFKININEYQ